jgi:hypothetical protein
VRRGRRVLGAALGLAAAAAAADDFPGDGRRRLRSVLPQRTVTQVIAEVGPADADRTVVVSAHHDAAHSGLIFHPAIPELADRAGFIENNDTSPPLIAIGVAGPLAAASVRSSAPDSVRRWRTSARAGSSPAPTTTARAF